MDAASLRQWIAELDARIESSAVPASGELHIWLVPLQAPELLAHHRHTLAPDELARAARFRFERDATRFIMARGWLRRILGAATGTRPSAVAFSYGLQGRPDFSDALRKSDVSFNVSHSAELAAIAVSAGHRVGIDIEEIREQIELEPIVKSHFSERERAEVLSLDSRSRIETFHRIWTRKEAYLKAIGEGVSRGLQNFTVSAAARRPALIEDRVDPAAPGRWFLFDLTISARFSGAVATEGNPLLQRVFGHGGAKSL
jgi:4'-phosphopantetheinyl transferase